MCFICIINKNLRKIVLRQYLTLVNGSTMRTTEVIKIGLTTSFELKN
jgi:hypothetical protein